ncbi:Glycosyl transferase, group 2 family protein [Marinilactibacillus psychrotolerans 42ea]|uniref:Glycosyl transferase, group 2 family protein n=1 Tax=Marinilactibacillus psychrotolerans 42ea TaxID=1255609 RepID=A0A1R4K0S5_9LACT|nr:glycosyltransferase family 2 protein [Marinilactibacillus psychrotolerans]SJN37886.1 Glycosyl transferase, group 2 family protein [Marinilactibacillus psychrotolerans 42ea]
MTFITQETQIVSIIMPAYNCEKYIYKAVKSVIDQTHQEWELIIIDDGSNDSTIRIIEEMANKYKKIRFFKNGKNLGVAATRNRGISLAYGEWIAFLDSDDIWDKTKLEKQMFYARKLSAEFLFTASSYIDEEGRPYQGVFEVPDKVSYKKLRNHNVISCSSVLIKKKYFENIKMEKDDMHEDYAVWLRIMRGGLYAYGINEPLLIYRISRNSKSGNKLKTITMTYKVFRFIGINPLGSVYFLSRHIIGSVRKYKKIKKQT